MENELSLDDKIKTYLLFYGVTKDLIIDGDEDKEMVLLALKQDDVESVSIDDEGGLCIMYHGVIMSKE